MIHNRSEFAARVRTRVNINTHIHTSSSKRTRNSCLAVGQGRAGKLFPFLIAICFPVFSIAITFHLSHSRDEATMFLMINFIIIFGAATGCESCLLINCC